jgi:hypothetical protein
MHVKESFFPYFPFRIPHQPGIAHWWDIFWWIVQLVVMTSLLIGLRRLGVGMDEEKGSALPAALRADAPAATPHPLDNGPGVRR